MTDFDGSIPDRDIEQSKLYAQKNAAAIVGRLFYTDEKEMPCVWIFTESLSQQVAWFHLKERLWLEVALELQNWPGASAHFVWWQDEVFRQHLLTHCNGWCVRENRGMEFLRKLGVLYEDQPYGGFVIGSDKY